MRENRVGHEALEDSIGYSFKDGALLERALTHSSYANEVNQRHKGKPKAAGGVEHNEMLEFLGDSILGFTIAEELYRARPDDNEGSLSRRRASVICEGALARCARDLGIGGLIRLGNNMQREYGQPPESVLSDAMEALFAAVYLDGGIDAARGVISRCMRKAIDDSLTPQKVIDHKSRLQEYLFGTDKNVRIVYSVAAENGPPHNRRYISQVAVNGAVRGSGEGATKKESEQNAAKEALHKLKLL